MDAPQALNNVLIIMIIFGSITVIVGLSLFIPLYFRARKRSTIYKTVELFSARNQPVPPEVMESLVGEQGIKASDQDLRRGVILLSVALALGVLGAVLSVGPLFGVAAFPGLMGVAYIGLHVYSAGRPA